MEIFLCRQIGKQTMMKIKPSKMLLSAFLLIATINPLNQSHAETSRSLGIKSASWYGKKFHGRLTANGERFDMNSLTAAHKTLKFGTKVKVTCVSTGKSVVVRINDRGPFHGNRAIDLSKAAATAIGLKDRGVGKVKLEIIE